MWYTACTTIVPKAIHLSDRMTGYIGDSQGHRYLTSSPALAIIGRVIPVSYIGHGIAQMSQMLSRSTLKSLLEV